jgi:NAD(P)-dependent dehydrogenase (short-subunit alcohol dehydrogenase family)
MGLLQDQVAIITGAGSGIGAATAVRFVKEGASVVLVGRTETKLENTRKGTDRPERVALAPGDVRKPETAAAAVHTAKERFGRLDILVSNAALCYPVRFPEQEAAEWFDQIDVILMGAFHFAREAAKDMIASRTAGRIVTVSSIHGIQVEPLFSCYAAAKGALNQFTRSLAVELAPHGIRANAVAPGFVDTPMSIVEGRNELEDPYFLKEYVERRRIPLARAAQPEEVASAILFLASDESSYVNGHVLVADGGLTLRF